MNHDLLKCPFCGADAQFEYDETGTRIPGDWNPDTGEGDDGTGWCKCTNPECGVGFHDDHGSAVEKWNKRANAKLTRSEDTKYG